jgi:myo-inositol-1-phosphate synthase
MSPTALNPDEAKGHHDSFTLPAVRNGHGGFKAEEVHASAARAPEGGRFKVESEDTTYEADGIRSRFVDRGAEVIRELRDPDRSCPGNS